MDEVAELLSRRATTFVGPRRRLVALGMISAAAIAIAFLVWRLVTRDTFEEPLSPLSPPLPPPLPSVVKAVRFSPTVHVRRFGADDDVRLRHRHLAATPPHPILKRA